MWVSVWVWVGVGGCDFFPSRLPAPSLHASGRRGSPLGMGEGPGAPQQPRGPRRTRPPVSRSRGLAAWEGVSGLPGTLPGLRTRAKTQIRRLLHPLPARPALRGSRLGSQGGPDVGCKGEEMEGGGHPARKRRLRPSVLHRHSSPDPLRHVGASPAGCPPPPHQLRPRPPAPGDVCADACGRQLLCRLRPLPWSCRPQGLLAGPGGSASSKAPGGV